MIEEVKLLQKVDNANIIQFFGSWYNEKANEVVFVTEILTSGTLKESVARPSPAWPRLRPGLPALTRSPPPMTCPRVTASSAASAAACG